jgi:predicted metal-binding membrane protein
MDGMPMPGGWTMSMVWMRMPEQTWYGGAVSFLGMWIVMMAVMMLPALVPMLWRYRRNAGPIGRVRLAWMTALVGLGYFLVWTLIGLAVYPPGLTLAAIEMEHPTIARLVPMAAGVLVLIAGAGQLTAWKARHLACCRTWSVSARARLPASDGEADARAALRHGLSLGVHCVCSSAGLTAVLLILGVMDVRVMAATTAAITLERLAPAGERIAQGIGMIVVAGGLLLVVRAVAG